METTKPWYSDTITVTVESLIAAAKKNGYIQSKDGWFKYERNYRPVEGRGTLDNPIVEACFIGQIAINLEVNYIRLSEFLDLAFPKLAEDIIRWNDGLGWDYDTILAYFLERVELGNESIKASFMHETYFAKTKKEIEEVG